MSSKPILVVDDEPLVCESLERLLRHDGHRTEIATSGADARTKFKEGRSDVVLLDYAMPEMMGDELAHALKQWESSPPLIMLAACPPDPPAQEIDLVMFKPASLEEIRKAISTVDCGIGDGL